MFLIRQNNIDIYPVSFNLYIKKFAKLNIEKEVDLFGERLDSEDVEAIKEDISNIENSESFIIIDFSQCMVVDGKNFGVFNELKRYKKIVFANIENECGMFDRIATDMEASVMMQRKEQGIIVSSDEVASWIDEYWKTDMLKEKYKKYIASIVYDSVDKNGKFFQESSCVYSSRYINIRKIFKKSMETRFLLYCLSYYLLKMKENVGPFKLISTSRTGAVIASMLSEMIKIPAVYCSGVGPRFAVKLDEIEQEIHEKERYVYVFDFMCLGTELKILSTFVSDRKAYLIGGVGVASYIRCDDKNIKDKGLILSKMKPLINVQDYKEIGYEISVP